MEARMPKMLSANQIEAHVTRLTAVREGLRKYEGDDARAKDAGEGIEVVIFTLQLEVSAPQKAAEEATAPIETVTPLTVDQVREMEDSLPTSSLKDEAEEAAVIGEAEVGVEDHEGPDAPSDPPPPTQIGSW